MERFGAGRSGGSDNPWFKIGDFGVGTAGVVAGAAILSMFVWAAEGINGPLFRHLWLVSRGNGGSSVTSGQVWRLLTWPIPNEPSIWGLLGIVIFYMLGSQLEILLGRRQFTFLLLGLTLIPASLATLVAILLDLNGGISGIRFLEIGVLVTFAAAAPHARSFFNIPLWVLVAVIVAIDVLDYLGSRNNYGLVLVFTNVFTALIAIRSFGHADHLPQIPKIALPTFITQTPNAAKPRRAKRGRGNLRAVPPPPRQAARHRQNDLADMEIDSLLDQVASDGIDSLTKEQRKRLKEHSDRLRREKGL